MLVYLTITGSINGVNDTFTLNAVPVTFELYRNGLLQAPGVDYTLTGGYTITFLAGSIPQTGDILLATTDATTDAPVTIAGVTVQEIYDQVCYALLEDGGLVLGVFTEAAFLEALAVVLLDFSQRASLDKHIFTEMVNAGVSEYIVPDVLMEPEMCFIGGRLIEKVSEADLTAGHLDWRMQWGVPRQWHEDNLDTKRLQVFPKPDYNGTNIAGSTALIGKYNDWFPSERNLTMVGPAAPSKVAWTLTDTIDGVPNSFSNYIVYGILAQVFSAEAETRDVQRAMYCRTRFEEGIALANALAREDLLEEQDA
jgi:hypothetical protein